MKTAEITRHKQAAAGMKPPSTWALFAEILRKEGIRGVNKGVNAVAIRQCTNWGSRIGFARLAEHVEDFGFVHFLSGAGDGCWERGRGHSEQTLLNMRMRRTGS